MVEGETSHDFDVPGGWWRKRNTVMSLHRAKGERLETKGLEHFDREDLWKGGPQSCRELCWRVSASAVTHRSKVPYGNLSAFLPSLPPVFPFGV